MLSNLVRHRYRLLSERRFNLLQMHFLSYVNKEVTVRVLDPRGEYEGIAHGINEKGELIVEKEDGSVENVYAGEVSVRGIYGYV